MTLTQYSEFRTIDSDPHMVNLMMGVAYLQNTAVSETDSPCPSPETVLSTKVADTTTKSASLENIRKPLGLRAGDYSGAVKKSVPFKKMSLQRKKKLLAMTNRERERILKRPKRRVASGKYIDIYRVIHVTYSLEVYEERKKVF